MKKQEFPVQLSLFGQELQLTNERGGSGGMAKGGLVRSGERGHFELQLDCSIRGIPSCAVRSR